MNKEAVVHIYNGILLSQNVAGYLDRETGHQVNKQEGVFIGASTGPADSHPKAELPSQRGFPFYIHFIHPHSYRLACSFYIRKVYFDWLVGCKRK